MGVERQWVILGSARKPKTKVAFAGASRSSSKVFSSRRAISYAILVATVVLPTPPAPFHTAITTAPGISSGKSLRRGWPSARICSARSARLAGLTSPW